MNIAITAHVTTLDYSVRLADPHSNLLDVKQNDYTLQAKTKKSITIACNKSTLPLQIGPQRTHIHLLVQCLQTLKQFVSLVAVEIEPMVENQVPHSSLQDTCL